VNLRLRTLRLPTAVPRSAALPHHVVYMLLQ
jgi:hypothetical protein